MPRDWESDDEDEDEDDDLAPLVRSSVKPLEITAPSRRHKKGLISRRNYIRFTLSVALVLSAFLGAKHSHKQERSRPQAGKGGQGECSETSTEALLDRIANSNSFCDESNGPEQQDCKCNNPIEAHLRVNKTKSFMELWNATFDRNKVAAAQLEEEYDVVLFGDSITEHWQGTELGFPVDEWQEINTIFVEKFMSVHGGRVEGLALGISGDRCAQLLYRLRHGELPESLDAKVFWLLIGVNDLGLDQCSAEAVVAGNIRIVEEIRALRPNAKIVLNSILPFAPEGVRDEGRLFENPKWRTASQVNLLLDCFASQTENVEFFNATDIFVTDDHSKTKPMFYEDAVHPSATGCRAWARSIVDTVLELIRKG